MSDLLSEYEKENFSATIENVKSELKSIEKELEKENSYKSYLIEKIQLLCWRVEYLKSICNEDGGD